MTMELVVVGAKDYVGEVEYVELCSHYGNPVSVNTWYRLLSADTKHY